MTHTASFDGWDPALQTAVNQARRRFPWQLADKAWRDERMLRYHYWLTHGGEHPGFNLFVSWTNDDLEKELAFWRGLDADDDPDALADVIRTALEQRYAVSMDDALALCTLPELATRGMPIWNPGAGVLMPQALGSLRLGHAVYYEGEHPGAGWGYSYRGSGQTLDLYLYDKGLDAVPEGMSESVGRELLSSLENVAQIGRGRVQFGEQKEPVIVPLTSRRGETWEFAVIEWDQVAGEVAEYSSLGVTGLAGHFLKTRYTAPMSLLNTAEFGEQATGMNADIANLCLHFSHRTSCFKPGE